MAAPGAFLSRQIPLAAACLGGAGLIPFVGAALCAVVLDDPDQRALALRAFAAYSAIILSFLGGWPAAWLAQQRLRHKTQKQPFRQIYFCTIAFNIFLISWLISPLNPFRG